MEKMVIAAAAVVALLTTGCGDSSQNATTKAAKASGSEPAQTTGESRFRPSPATRRAPDEYNVESFKVVYEYDGTESGTMTLWVEDYGNRVAMETDLVTKMGRMQQPRRQRAYWDGDRMYLQDLTNDSVWESGLRMKDMEPSAFAITSDQDLERVGYERIGDQTIAGKTCEFWRNEGLNFEACRWNRVDLMSDNRAISDKTDGVRFAKKAVEFVEGEIIPADFKSLAR